MNLIVLEIFAKQMTSINLESIQCLATFLAAKHRSIPI